MIFMNFIIAVIGESYSKVTQFAEAHDYHQRSKLIYEMELHFNQSEIEKEDYFPNILIVRKKKLNSQLQNNWQNYIRILKQFSKEQATKSRELISSKAKESKEQFQNSIK